MSALQSVLAGHCYRVVIESLSKPKFAIFLDFFRCRIFGNMRSPTGCREARRPYTRANRQGVRRRALARRAMTFLAMLGGHSRPMMPELSADRNSEDWWASFLKNC
jgi:hypothetical protein